MQHAHHDYQANEILTASPARLHLLLLEGAVRHTRQALAWMEQEEAAERATDAVVAALKIMSELISSLKPAHDRQLVKQVAGEYVFVVRALSEGNLHRDPEELRGALRVLEVQRETWRQLNQQLQATTAASGAASADEAAAIPSPRMLKPKGATQSSATAASRERDEPGQGLLLDA